MTAPAHATRFWDAVRAGDVPAAMALTAPDVVVSVPPAGIDGGSDALRAFLASTVATFPDLEVTDETGFTASDGVEVTSVRMEGTQSADWLGIVNQEKFLDVRQVWRFRIEDGLIAGVSAYWDQNQVYRRLAVKRLDQVAIV